MRRSVGLLGHATECCAQFVGFDHVDVGLQQQKPPGDGVIAVRSRPHHCDLG
jgi:hypothetical protein